MEILRNLLIFLELLLSGMAIGIIITIVIYALYKLLFRNFISRQ